MASSPPQYTLLPSSPVAHDEKPALQRTPSATPQSSSLSSPDSSSRSRFRRAIFFITGALAVTVLVASLYATNLALGGGAGGCSRWRAGASETSHDEDMTRLRKRDAAVQSPTYSTSTYTNGETSTFVYTTRPIVNPGGYTIGTMTGYVIDKPTATSESVSASSASEPASSTSASWSEVQETAETASPSYSTSTGSTGTETYVYTTRPIVNPGGYTIGTMTGYVPIPTTAISSSTRKGFSTTTIPSATPTAAPLAERDFAEVDMHLLHRRGVDFEEAAVADESATAKTEYSYSTKKDGATVTYVKTTRPIVNPGGYTIGTLDGAYVKAPKSTQLQARDELKRRAIELEA